MKKIKLISSICLLSALMFVSCDKTVTSSPVSIDDYQTGTLRIYPKADLDLTEEGNELLPVGTVVTMSVAYSKYNTTGNGNPDGSYIASDSVNADGYVEFVVPVDGDGVSVMVSVNSFAYDQLQADGKTVAKLYSFPSTSYNVYSNVFTLKEIASTSIMPIDESSDLYQATLNLTLYTDYDKTKVGYELVPEGTQVIISNFSRGTSDTIVTVDALGQISLKLAVDADADNFKIVVLPFVIENGKNGEGELMTVEYTQQTLISVALARGDVKTEDRFLSDGNFVEGYENLEMVTISGIISAELDAKESGLEALNFQAITFFTFDFNDEKNWSTTVTTDKDGKYTVKVPENAIVKYSIAIESIERTISEWDDDDAKYVYVDKYYRLNIDKGTAFISSAYDDGENDFTVSGFIEIVLP